MHVGFEKPFLNQKEEVFMLDKRYIINGGDIFEGTIEQFQDCFFSNATEETIKQWCKDNNYVLNIVYEAEEVDKKLAFYRQGYFFFEKNLIQMLEAIVDLVDPRFQNNVLIISAGKRSLVIFAPNNYIKVLEVIPDEDKDSMEIRLIANHDSCWRGGIERFVKTLFESRLQDLEEVNFAYVLHAVKWQNLNRIKPMVVQAFKKMDYHTFRKETVIYDQNIFPILSSPFVKE